MSQKILRHADRDAIFRESAPVLDDRHPDVLESQQLYGTAHNSNGRVLPRYRLAATPQQQEARLAQPEGWALHKVLLPSPIAVEGARTYNQALGLPDPHSSSYDQVMQTPQRVRAVGRAYDALPAFDPAALPSYQAMHHEIGQQYNHMTNNLGIDVQSVDHDPYPDVDHMVNDVNNNRRLQVLSTATTGGHPFFSNEDNDKFRAVHDFFGHAATGRGFDRHGEQAAFLAHAQMFSPQARPALASETLGQNSSLILNGEFPQQKVATLPQQHWNTLPAVAPEPRVAAPHPGYERGSPQWSNDVLQQVNRQPAHELGVTVRDTLPDKPEHGYMVSLDKERKQPYSTLTPSDVGAYVREHQPDIDAHPDNFYGGWHDEENARPYWYHDVSRNVLDPWEAADTALHYNQRGVFNLDKGTTERTPEFFHDQIAKGGRHDHGQCGSSDEPALCSPGASRHSGSRQHLVRDRTGVADWSTTESRSTVFEGQKEAQAYPFPLDLHILIRQAQLLSYEAAIERTAFGGALLSTGLGLAEGLGGGLASGLGSLPALMQPPKLPSTPTSPTFPQSAPGSPSSPASPSGTPPSATLTPSATPLSAPPTMDPSWAATHTKGLPFSSTGMPTNLGTYGPGNYHPSGTSGATSFGDTSHLPFSPGGGSYTSGGGATGGGADPTARNQLSYPSSGGGSSGNGSAQGGAESWRPMVHEEFTRLGPQYGITSPEEEKKWEDAAVSRIGIESGGNPNAINNTDENAIAGHPSQGILQFIPTSLHQYEPGASMTDPKAEIDAFIPYSQGRGLSPETGLGTAHNY